MVGTFALAGDVPLGEIAEFYCLPIPARHHASTAAQLFDTRFDGNPQIGDRLTLGEAMLIVRKLHEERVSQVGLKFVGVGSRVFGADADRKSTRLNYSH